MPRVWKYILNPGINLLNVPVGARVLSVANQRDSMVLWMLLEPSEQKEAREFLVVGTGHNIDHHESALFFIGTVQFDWLVFHAFEVRR